MDGNSFHITTTLSRDSTVKPVMRRFDVSLLLAWISIWTSIRVAGELRRLNAHVTPLHWNIHNEVKTHLCSSISNNPIQMLMYDALRECTSKLVWSFACWFIFKCFSVSKSIWVFITCLDIDRAHAPNQHLKYYSLTHWRYHPKQKTTPR